MSRELQILKARMSSHGLAGPNAEHANLWKELLSLLGGGGCTSCEPSCETCQSSCSGGHSNGA